MTIDLDLSIPRNEVRVISGDVNLPYLVADTVIDYLLSINNNDVYKTALKCLEYIIAGFSNKIDQEVGDVRVSYSQLLNNFKKLYDALVRDPSRMSNVALHTFGGTTVSEIKRVNSNLETPAWGLLEGHFTGTNTRQRDPNNPYSFL